MAASGSKKVIYGAIFANLGIAIAKFVASVFTGSSAMLAEGIHSMVDTTNGVLLLFGIGRSKRAPTAEHPFGYGKEVYFWAFIVAIMIFGLGGGFAIYEGIHHIQHPGEIGDPTWNYVVLGIAILLEGAAFTIAYREFKKAQGKSGILRGIRESKDAATFAILIEDSAAMAGLIAALIGVTLTQLTGIAEIDGVTSVVIGTILCVVAVFLANEARGLLVGEAIRPAELEAIKKLLDGHELINRYNEPRSMHLGPNEVLLTVDIDFKHGLDTRELELIIEKIEADIKTINPKIDKIYIETKGIAKPS